MLVASLVGPFGSVFVVCCEELGLGLGLSCGFQFRCIMWLVTELPVTVSGLGWTVSPSVGMGTHMERARAWGSASHYI